MYPGLFFAGEPTYYSHPDDTDTKALPLIVRINQVLLWFLFKKVKCFLLILFSKHLL